MTKQPRVQGEGFSRAGGFKKIYVDGMEISLSLIAAAEELLEVAELFLRSIDYQIKKDKRDGDIEGANLKATTRATVASVIAKARGKL